MGGLLHLVQRGGAAVSTSYYSESLDIFRRHLKTELFARSYNWHRVCQTTLLLRDPLLLSLQLFAVVATLKSIDYNVAMTFILNNNNNIRRGTILTFSGVNQSTCHEMSHWPPKQWNNKFPVLFSPGKVYRHPSPSPPPVCGSVNRVQTDALTVWLVQQLMANRELLLSASEIRRKWTFIVASASNVTKTITTRTTNTTCGRRNRK